jgi:hypothetical protein
MTQPLDVQIARRARQLLSDQRHFCTFAVARTHDQRPCSPLSPSAARWCARGALVKAAFEFVGDTKQAWALGQACEGKIFPGFAPRFNDKRGHRAVVEKLTIFLDRHS